MRNYRNIPEQHFDYAIVGAGLSGLMLAMALLENEATAGKRILLLDKSLHDHPPGTWCFWEKEDSKWEALVDKSWCAAEFFEGKDHLKIDLCPYRYKMIGAERFREKAWDVIKKNDNVCVRQAPVESLEAFSEFVWIGTPRENYTASLVFDSRWDGKALEKHRGHVLYQQFSGWWVQSDTPVFDERTARLMDFRMEQQGSVAFCYLLPVTGGKALVEYTLFTPGIRCQEGLETALEAYLAAHFPGVRMQVCAREKGVIPMTDMPVTRWHPRVVPIGTAGGCTKPSSGYTFMFVREQTEEIIEALNRGEFPGHYAAPRRFRFYDGVLLRVLLRRPEAGARIFFRMFQRNAPETVLDFMRNRSGLREEVSIFMRLPWRWFIPAAVREACASGHELF